MAIMGVAWGHVFLYTLVISVNRVAYVKSGFGYSVPDYTYINYSPDLSRYHEGGSAGPLRCGKGSTWEGGVRVPAIARWLGRIPAGRRSMQLASHLDLYPTIMRIAGGKKLKDRKMDGVDMSRVLYRKSGRVREREGGREITIVDIILYSGDSGVKIKPLQYYPYNSVTILHGQLYRVGFQLHSYI